MSPLGDWHSFMSAYPQKRTSLSTAVMSAKCQKRTLERRLFNHVVCAGDQRRWHVKAEHLRGLKVDDKLVFGRCLHRKVDRLLALETKSGRRIASPQRSGLREPRLIHLIEQSARLETAERVDPDFELTNGPATQGQVAAILLTWTTAAAPRRCALQWRWPSFVQPTRLAACHV
jgi:hypothetical protein